MNTALTPLLARLPPAGSSPDDVFLAFLEHVTEGGRELYPAQEEAILELFARKNVILNTPTGSGKSLVALAAHVLGLAEKKRSFYTSPIKALASEKFFALCKDLGAENVGMLTGDASINRDAPVICCTAEILANMALREGEKARVDYVIMDEFHYYSDRERGVAWEVPLLALPQATFLLMSATLGNAEYFQTKLTELTKRPTALVRSEQRPVPLEFEYSEIPLHETLDKLIELNRYPIYLVHFTQRSAAEQAQNLMSSNFSSKEDKQAITEALTGVRFDSPYGKELQRYVRHGIGLHHAGLLPKYRLLVEKLAQKGLLKVICGTDTLGVGINVPIRTVLFTQLCKFDGEKTTILSVRDFKQIAGRAGRKGFDSKGFVVAQAPEHVIENLRLMAKQTSDGKPKKIVPRKPPDKGYVHWDKETFQRLQSKPSEALVSRFRVTHGMLLNVLLGEAEAHDPRGGYGRMLRVLQTSHLSPKDKAAEKIRTRTLFQSLRSAGVVRLERRENRNGSRVVLGEGLDEDFSLHHALGLFMLDTLEKLPRDDPEFARNVLTLVEATIENPDVILQKQLDKLKQEKLAELKADGVEYEERMAELEKLEYPKPLRDFLYATYNDFAAKHPWLEQDNIRPKSIARELWERGDSFGNYVVEYGLQRSEGVLLRYLSDVYRVLSQSVPEVYRDDEVLDIAAYLRTLLRRVDSSLVEEWESLQQPAEPEPERKKTPRVKPLAEDPKALAARLRSEVHRLVQAIAAQDWEEACWCVRSVELDPWTPAQFEAAMKPFFSEYGRVRTDEYARDRNFTAIKQVGPLRWSIRQTLVDPQDDNFWYLDCVADLSQLPEPSEPLIELTELKA